jgi:uncharacterized protein (DUF1800 family)
MAWECPSPEGYADETPEWLNPDAMRIRLDVAQLVNYMIARDGQTDVVQIANNLFDAALSHATRQRLAGVGAIDGLTILFSSPEFQRR